jgi:hypothetical protein
MSGVDRQHFALLTMLLAMTEQALQAFYAADNPVDEDLVADLERVVARTRREIDALTGAG